MSFENLSDETLDLIEKCGRVYFTYEQTAKAVGIPVAQMMEYLDNENHPAHEAYHRGKHLSLLNIRLSIIRMAENGSAPAQSLMQKIIDDYEFRQKTKN